MTEFALKDRVSFGGMTGTVLKKTYDFDERTYVIRLDIGGEREVKGSQLERIGEAA